MSLVLTAKQNDCIIIDGKTLQVAELAVHISAKVTFDGGPVTAVDKTKALLLDGGVSVKLAPQEPALSSVKLVFDAPQQVLILRQKVSAAKK